MKNLALILILLLTAVANSSGQQSQDSGFGTIVGTVVDSATGKPLSSAWIDCAKTALGCLTSIDGKFVVANVPLGIYILNVGRQGCYPRTIPNVEVTARQLVQVDIRLTRICQESQLLRLAARDAPRLAAPIKKLNDAESDLFSCAAQIAGNNTDPEGQEDGLMQVVNKCCGASRFDKAVDILESITDESVKAGTLAGIDSLSLADRRMLEYKRSEIPPEAYDRWDAEHAIRALELSPKPAELERLVAMTQSFSTPENRILSLTKTGSLLCRYGDHDRGIATLHSALPALDSVRSWPYCEELGRALLDAGDRTTGVGVLGRALVRWIDSCSSVTPTVNWNYEVLQTMIDIGAYDAALEIGLEQGDLARVQSDIAVSWPTKDGAARPWRDY